ncbi:MAG: hypothetical protein VXW65_02330 [Pseudomonadota bacterium]|nr:hypothetical protein [Pseudomonadota bacterium]
MIVSRHTMRPSDRAQSEQLAAARAKRDARQVWIVEFVRGNGVKFALGNTLDTAIIMLEQNGKFWLHDGRGWDRTTVGQIVIDRLHAAVRAVRSGKASLVAAPKPTPSQLERIKALDAQRSRIAAAQKAREAAQSRSNAVSFGGRYFDGKRSQSVRDDRNWGEC